MDKFFCNVIYVLITLAFLTLFEKVFRNEGDNFTFNKVYKIVLGIFWITVAIVTVLLYWVGYGYLKQGSSSIAIKLFMSGTLMTLSIGYKVYTTFGNKNERN